MTTERISPPPPADAPIRVLAAGKLRWPSLIVNSHELRAYLLERGVTPEGLTPAIACDLFLSFACFSKVAGAVQVFQTTYDPVVVAAAKRLDRSGGMVDELRQRLWEILFVGSGRGGPRIGEYRGRGPLSAWVRTCAKRAALRLAKSGSSEALMTRDEIAVFVLSESAGRTAD
jgi:RNA polymerase sigma-70 factor (ECF subfamily)